MRVSASPPQRPDPQHHLAAPAHRGARQLGTHDPLRWVLAARALPRPEGSRAARSPPLLSLSPQTCPAAGRRASRRRAPATSSSECCGPGVRAASAPGGGAGWRKLGAGLRRLLQRGRQQVSPGRLLGWLVGFCCCFFFSFPIFLVLKSAARGRWSANRPRAGCVGAACVGAGRAALAARPEGAASARGSAPCERQLSARCGGSGARGSAPMWLVMKRPPPCPHG